MADGSEGAEARGSEQARGADVALIWLAAIIENSQQTMEDASRTDHTRHRSQSDETHNQTKRNEMLDPHPNEKYASANRKTQAVLGMYIYRAASTK